jgi:hypothetical protein
MNHPSLLNHGVLQSGSLSQYEALCIFPTLVEKSGNNQVRACCVLLGDSLSFYNSLLSLLVSALDMCYTKACIYPGPGSKMGHTNPWDCDGNEKKMERLFALSHFHFVPY